MNKFESLALSALTAAQLTACHEPSSHTVEQKKPPQEITSLKNGFRTTMMDLNHNGIPDLVTTKYDFTGTSNDDVASAVWYNLKDGTTEQMAQKINVKRQSAIYLMTPKDIAVFTEAFKAELAMDKILADKK